MLSEIALVKARRCVESTYDGVCDVVEFADVTDSVTGLTSKKETVVAVGVPCRVSFERSAAAVQGDAAAGVSQTVKLFVAPEVEVRPGAKIVVTQNGRTAEYACSGAPAVYPTHQEIVLQLFRERA